MEPSGCAVGVYVSVTIPVTPPDKATMSGALNMKLPSAARIRFCVWLRSVPDAVVPVGALADAAMAPNETARILRVAVTPSSCRLPSMDTRHDHPLDHQRSQWTIVASG